MERFVSKDGTTIGCRTSGWGPPILLVHGTAADLTQWAPVLPALDQGFTVHAMDRRGQGVSDDAPEYVVLSARRRCCLVAVLQ